MSSNEADLVLGGGTIRTPAHPSGFVQALAIRDGVIAAVGSDEEIRELTGRRTRVIDLRGRLALPAFGERLGEHRGAGDRGHRPGHARPGRRADRAGRVRAPGRRAARRGDAPGRGARSS